MTEMSRERREKIEADLNERGVLALERITPREIRALLSDSAWRERVERQVRELADELTPYEVLTGEDEIHARVAGRLRAIVDTGRDDTGEQR